MFVSFILYQFWICWSFEKSWKAFVDVDPQVRQETQYIGDCCTLTFFEFRLSMQKDGFHDKD